MSEPPGLPSSLGIESVECIPEGGSLTVRVTGRWRRRRPEWRGPAILVVEAQGTRYRFPAMPEPPSLTGTMPGTWRMTFSVARELGPHLAGRSWLQLGSVVAPLPVFAETKIGAPPEGSSPSPGADEPDPERLPPRRFAGELAVDTARRRADEAEGLAAELALRVDQLERALEEARAQPARLERARRAAEQSAHAEAARRMELEEQLAEQERALEDARARAAALARRVEELEDELRRLRRAADEAMHLAASERAARLRVERAALERPPPEPQNVHADALAERIRAGRQRTLEAEDRHARIAVDPAPARALIASPGELTDREARAARDELEMRRRRSAPRPEGEPLPSVVERERARRVEAEQRVAALEGTLAERTGRWARAYAEIDLIRDEIGELRRVFSQIESTAAPPPDPAGPIRPERLSDALARLREQAEPPDEGASAPAPASAEPPALQVPPVTSPRDRYDPFPGATGKASVPPPGPGPATEPTQPVEPVAAPAPSAESIPPPSPAPAGGPSQPAKPWLWPIFRTLVREDPLFAGQLILQLLPAWHAVHPLPVAGDLILGDRACVQLTVAAGKVEVRPAETPRRPEDVHFQATGDLRRLARAVAAGRLRRRLGRGMARVSGDVEAFSRMGLLVRSPLTLGELHAAGVRLDPALVLSLLTRMIDPAWTVGERFTIAHRLPDAAVASGHLEVRDGAPVSASDRPPAGPADTTIVSRADSLLAVLAGQPGPEVRVEGRPDPLALLRGWIDRAQSA